MVKTVTPATDEITANTARYKKGVKSYYNPGDISTKRGLGQTCSAQYPNNIAAGPRYEVCDPVNQVMGINPETDWDTTCETIVPVPAPAPAPACSINWDGGNPATDVGGNYCTEYTGIVVNGGDCSLQYYNADGGVASSETNGKSGRWWGEDLTPKDGRSRSALKHGDKIYAWDGWCPPPPPPSEQNFQWPPPPPAPTGTSSIVPRKRSVSSGKLFNYEKNDNTICNNLSAASSDGEFTNRENAENSCRDDTSEWCVFQEISPYDTNVANSGKILKCKSTPAVWPFQPTAPETETWYGSDMRGINTVWRRREVSECPAGTFASNGVCRRCPMGTYSSATGATSDATCTECPVNQFSSDGSTSVADCIIGGPTFMEENNNDKYMGIKPIIPGQTYKKRTLAYFGETTAPKYGGSFATTAEKPTRRIFHYKECSK